MQQRARRELVLDELRTRIARRIGLDVLAGRLQDQPGARLLKDDPAIAADVLSSPIRKLCPRHQESVLRQIVNGMDFATEFQHPQRLVQRHEPRAPAHNLLRQHELVHRELRLCSLFAAAAHAILAPHAR